MENKPDENILIWINFEQYDHLKDVSGFIEVYQYGRCDYPQPNEMGKLQTPYSNIRFFIKSFNETKKNNKDKV